MSIFVDLPTNLTTECSRELLVAANKKLITDCDNVWISLMNVHTHIYLAVVAHTTCL